MTEESFAKFAGHVLFPRTPLDLTSTAQCPACFAKLSSAVCGTCGLDLTHPLAAELAAVSASVAATLDERLELIGHIRFDMEQARKAAAASVLAPPPVFVPPVAPPVAAPVVPTPVVAAAAAPAPAVVAEPVPSVQPVAPPVAPVTLERKPRGRSIQVLLLLAGVSLLSLAAVLFIVFAFINYGLVVRSIIIGLLTIAAFVVASLLRRRGLTGTAEGIAAFAVVLVYVDAFAVQSNNLFGAGDVAPSLYWGYTLLLSAVGFIVWHRFSALRTANVAGFAAVGPGAALLVGGYTIDLDPAVNVFLMSVALALAGLLHPLAARRASARVAASAGLPERIIVLSVALYGLVIAYIAGFLVAGHTFWGGTLAVLATVAIAAAHVVIGTRFGMNLRTIAVSSRIFAGLGAFAAATAVAVTLTRNPEPEFSAIAPLVAAAFVALALDVLARPTAAPLRSVWRVGSVAAAVPATVGLLVVGAFAVAPVARVVLQPWRNGTLEATSEVGPANPVSAAAVIALAVVVALVVGASAASAMLLRRRTLIVAAAALVAIVAVPLALTLWVVLAGWVALAAMGVTVLAFRRGSVALRVVAAIGSTVAISLAYAGSWLSDSTWLAVSIAAIVLLVVARLGFTSVVGRAVLLVVAASVAFVAAAALARQFDPAPFTGPVSYVGVASAAILVLASLPRAIGLSVSDRRALYWTAAPVAGIATFSLWILADAIPVLAFAVSAAFLLGLLLWIVLRGNAPALAERVVASIALTGAAFWTLDAALRLTDLPQVAHDLTPIIAALLVAVGALVISIVRPSGTPRWSREIGVVLVAVPAVFFAVGVNTELTWLVLVLAGITTLFLAISADGLFASGSGRKHLGWIALALVTAGLWWRLGTGSVSAVEPYVLPVAGALLLIALLVWRVSKGSSAAPLIALGGLLVAVLPIGIAGATGAIERALIVGIASAVLLLAASFIRGASAVRPYLDVAATAGALGVLVVTVGRAWFLSLEPGVADWRLDAWVGAAFVVLFAAAVGQLLPRSGSTTGARGILGQALGVTAVTVLAGFEIANFAATDLGQIRVLATLVLLSLAHVVAITVRRGAFHLPLAIVSLGFTAVAALAAVFTGALTVLEITGLLVILALASSITALVVSLRAPGESPRWQREAGLASLAGVSILALLTARNLEDATWLILVTAAVVALLLAVSPDGLFGAESKRKHLGWLALALAVAGLWWRLAGAQVDNLEPYVLPLAGALLLIALFVWRANRWSEARGAAPLITLGALLVAVLPLALNAATGDPVRAIVVGAASAALLLVGSLVVGDAQKRPYLDAAALTGVIGVLVVTIGRAYFIAALPGTADATLDAWLGAAFAVLLVAAVGQARTRVGDNPRLRSIASQTLGIVALAVVFFFEVINLTADDAGRLRALLVVLVFSAVHVVAFAVDRTPLSRLVAWVSFGAGAAVSIAGMVVGALDPIELGTVPLAIALIASGAIRLARVPAARSWPNLGPALLVLFVPSLLATIDDRPIWRVAAIAVVGIATIIIGLVRKLQAPFLIGSLVTIVHVFATFSPQLRELYETSSWVVWIIIGTIGGTLLIVFAARFEKSLQAARSTFERVSQLR